MKKLFSILSLAAVMLASCNLGSDDDSINVNEITTDWCMISTDSKGQMISARTDQGLSLIFDKPIKVDGMERPDTAYRSVLQFGFTDSDKKQAKPLSLREVRVPEIQTPEAFEGMTATPIERLESFWKAKSAPYVNMEIIVMTGSLEQGKRMRTIGLSKDSIRSVNGVSTVYISLRHSQGDVTAQNVLNIPLSIPTQYLNADSLHVTFNAKTGKKSMGVRLRTI